MTQDDKQPTNPQTPEEQKAHEEPLTGASIAGEPAAPNAESAIEGEDTGSQPESTVGTGTSIALGCVAGTVLLIFFGLIFLAIMAIL